MNRARSLIGGLLAFSLLNASPAFAQPATKPTSDVTRDAGRHFQRGVTLYNEADYAGASAEFKKAYELAPNAAVLFNIGQTEFQLRSYAAALQTFERYIADAGPTAEHRADAEANIETLRSRVGKIEVLANDGTEVTIDDELAGKAPLAPIQAAVGRRKVTISKDGAQQTRFVEVAAGETVRVELKVGTPARGETTKDSPPPAAPRSSAPAALWIGSGALLAGAVVTGIVALGKSSDLSDERAKPAGGTTRAQLDDLQSQTKTFALVTDILGGAAIVTGGVALYFTLKKPSTTAAASSVQVGLGVSRIALEGTF